MVVSCLSTFSFHDIAGKNPNWALQVYPFKDRAVTNDLISAALAEGARAVIYTADVPVPGLRSRDRRNGFTGLVDSVPYEVAKRVQGTIWDAWSESETWDDVARLAESLSVPLAVKGVLHPDDAAQARAIGAAAIWISSHGGRQLDSAIAPLDVLPRIAETVGDDLELVIDGSPLPGVDVAMALAMGANAVAIGRPAMWGLAAAGDIGVARVFDLLVQELENALILMGASSPSALDNSYVGIAASLRLDQWPEKGIVRS
jgi:4-hydroxymandelate oxidase